MCAQCLGVLLLNSTRRTALQFANDWATVVIGDQADPEFWTRFISGHSLEGAIDIFLDDGGHSMAQQSNTFDAVFRHVRSDVVYLCEDLSTSYLRKYGGAPKTAEELRGSSQPPPVTMADKAKLVRNEHRG